MAGVGLEVTVTVPLETILAKKVVLSEREKADSERSPLIGSS